MAAAGWGREQEIERLAGKLSRNFENEDHMIAAAAQPQPVTMKQPQLSQKVLTMVKSHESHILGTFYKSTDLRYLVQKLLAYDAAFYQDKSHDNESCSSM